MALVEVSGEIVSTEYGKNKVVDTKNVHDEQGHKLSDILDGIKGSPFHSIRRVEPYLYEVEYDSMDYAFADEYFNRIPAQLGGCSVIRREDFIYRNLDWLDDYEAIFVVRTNNVGRFASVGVAGSLKQLTIQKVESGEYDEAYKVLPFFMQDGVNERGLFAEMNVAPYNGTISKTTPAVTKRESICAIALVRYILDKFSSVSEAVEYINNYVEVYLPQSLIAQGYELHYMLANGNNTFVLEMHGTSWTLIESNISTNFHLHGVTFNPDGSVPVMGENPTSKGIDQYGTGLERWNILNAGGSIKDVLFSKAYTNIENVWNSEFVGGIYDVDSNPSAAGFQMRIAEYRQKYIDRSKDDPQTWLTVHSSEYDMTNLSVRVSVQEGDTEHDFGLQGGTNTTFCTDTDIDNLFV